MSHVLIQLYFDCMKCIRVETGLSQSANLGQMGHFLSGSFGSLSQAQKNLGCPRFVILSNIAVTNDTSNCSIREYRSIYY